MSRTRLVLAGCIAAALLVLAGWQLQREWLIKTCLDGGGAWTARPAARSRCGPFCSAICGGPRPGSSS